MAVSEGIHINNDSSHFSPGRLVETAKFLVDAKSSLLEDLNVENEDLSKAGHGSDDQNHQPVQNVSKGGRVRADRVRSYIHYFYHLMEEEVESGNSRGTVYQGVEGVYNPLQVIRNRKVKKKQHHHLRNEIAFLKPPILAIRDFSSQPERDFPWFVDVTERSGDLSWRMTNWEHLRRPDGKRWFAKHHNRGSHSTTVTSRSSPGQLYKDNNGLSSSKDPQELPALAPVSASGLKLPTISVESVDQTEPEQPARSWDKALIKNKLLPRPEFHGKGIGAHYLFEDRGLQGRGYASHEQLSHTTPTRPSYHHRNASDIQIRNLRRPNNLETPSNTDSNSNQASCEFLELKSPFEPAPLENTIFETQCNDLKYLSCVWSVMHNRQKTLCTLQTRRAKKDQLITFDDPNAFCEPAEKALHDYRNELLGALKTCDIWKSRLLNDYSIRVESLLSSSDRVLSDINTTLTLRLKQLQEKIDRFGTLRRMNKEPLRIFLYRALEVLIVLLFWIIWFCFTVLKSVKFVILTLYRIASSVAW
ncbi:LAFA_0D13322g1_1 [Lachancea sp. 'fantastica']|nr:LAFA_0D13322g1_1 [Lachancea sp. 'fantastica']